MRRFFLAVSLLLLFAFFAIAQTGETFRVEGAVTNAATGEPVSNASIGIQFLNGPAPGSAARTTTSDAGGHWEFSGLSEGSYLLWGERRGFAREQMGGATGQDGILVGPSRTGAVTLRLRPFGSVTGTVTDENGDPIMGAHVEIIQAELINGRRTMRHVQSTTTNDIGVYRAANLAVSKTYVMAWIQEYGEEPTAYPPVFYGGGNTLASAVPVDPASGNIAKADVRLEPASVFHVRGRVLDMPPQGGIIALNSQALPAGIPDMTRPVQLTADGNFDVRDVTPGAYRLTATAFQGKERRSVMAEVTVGSADVEGLQLTPVSAPEVTGRVRLEVPEGTPGLDLAGINLFFQPKDFGNAPYASARLNPDGTFVVAGLGITEYVLAVRVPEPFFLKSAVAGNLDLLTGTLPVLPGIPIAPVDLVISSGGGEISGTISSDGQPGGSSVVLLKRQNTTGTAQDKLLPTSAAGKFVIRGIPPGDYRLYAWRDLRGVEYANPDALQQYRSESITISANGRETVDLKLNSPEPQ